MNPRSALPTPRLPLQLRRGGALVCFAAALVATSLYRGATTTSIPAPIYLRDALVVESAPSSSERILYYPTTDTTDDGDERYRRELSVALADGGCEVTHAEPAPHYIPPTWQASFPGSGSRMTWVLIEALTGVITNNDYDSHSRGYENVVAVKTHYPVSNARGFPKLDPMFGRAIVILRNPLHAIPSLFNYAWEHEHHLPNHSTRGPMEDWLKYRVGRRGVDTQLALFEKFVTYWMSKYPEDEANLLLVSYEDLIREETGPGIAGAIASFLTQEGVEPIASASIPCVWETIVNYKSHTGGEKEEEGGGGEEEKGEGGEEEENEEGAADRKKNRRRRLMDEISGGNRRSEAKLIKAGKTQVDPLSLRTGPNVHPYRKKMLDDMLAMLEGLLVTFGHHADLNRILSSYIDTVLKTPVEEGLEEASGGDTDKEEEMTVTEA